VIAVTVSPRAFYRFMGVEKNLVVQLPVCQLWLQRIMRSTHDALLLSVPRFATFQQLHLQALQVHALLVGGGGSNGPNAPIS
jgi:hypothetical protein